MRKIKVQIDLTGNISGEKYKILAWGIGMEPSIEYSVYEIDIPDEKPDFSNETYFFIPKEHDSIDYSCFIEIPFQHFKSLVNKTKKHH